MEDPKESELETGATVGDYEVLGVVGNGGMGRVYRVRNRISGRIEAMKVILPNLEAEPELAQRFLTEIRTLASLQHPNIAQLYTALTDGNRLVMLMEYVEGVSLSERLRTSPPSLEQSLDYCLQALKALEYAHERNIVHRDVKPANMMVTPGGVVKLLDFGIAKSGHAQMETSPGMPLGSVRYASPEQLRGDPIDGRSDLYALGVTLYELLTHRLPFEADNSFALLQKQLNEEPPPPRQYAGSVPESLNEIILMTMEKSPDRRFKNAAALSRALESVARSLTPVRADAMANTLPLSPSPSPSPSPVSAAAAPAAPAPVPGRPRSSRSFWMAYGAVAALVVIAGAAILVPRYAKTAASTAPSASVSALPAAGSGPDNNGQKSQNADAVGNDAARKDDAADRKDNSVSRTVSAEDPASPPVEKGQPKTRISKTFLIPPASPAASETAQPQPPPDQPVPLEGSPKAARDAGAASSLPAREPANAASADTPSPQQLNERFDQLTARAAAAGESVERIRAEQDSVGLGLRGDIPTALRQMQTYLARAEQELQNQNGQAAQTALDKAEQSLEKLEKFLGK